jgi:hypothetical protein
LPSDFSLLGAETDFTVGTVAAPFASVSFDTTGLFWTSSLAVRLAQQRSSKQLIVFVLAGHNQFQKDQLSLPLRFLSFFSAAIVIVNGVS